MVCLRILGWAFLLLATSCYAAQSGRRPAPSRPNLLLITIDTLRPDHLGCYGAKGAITPNIDSLALNGIRFRNAYAVVPTTLPSHTTILTGTYPMLNGMHDFSGNRLSQSQPTLATVMKKNGYVTGAVVGAAVLDSRFGLNNGFDFYYDHFDFSRLADTNLDAMERPADVVVDEALKWLAKNKTRPFLLWVHIYDPHYPYHPPEPFATRYHDRPYDGEIAFADQQVGRLLAALKSANLYNRTLVAVMGDHGEGLGEHGERTHGFFIYDSTMRVPLLLKPPANHPPMTVETAVSLVDVLPTLLDFMKLTPPTGLQGRTLKPLVASGGESPSPVYSETFLPRLHFNWSELRGLHRENYHFIEGPKPELYDTANDPGETRNLYAGKPAIAQELRSGLARVIREFTPETELAEKTSLDPAMMERLKSLGYVAVASGSSTTLSNKALPDPKDRLETYELISAAIEDSQHGRFDPSIEKLDLALQTEKDSVPIHYLQGINHYRKRDFPSAVKQFSRVLELSPDYALAAYYLGLAQAASEDWDGAIAALQKAVSLDKTNFAAAYNLGAAYVQKRAFPEAFAAFRQAVEINPEYALAHRAAGELHLFAGDMAQAEASLKRAAELAPQDIKVHVDLAQLYKATGRNMEAQQEMAIAVNLRNAQTDR